MIGKFLLLGVLIIPIFAAKHVPLKDLYRIVRYYPRVSFCDRNITSGYWMETGNVRHITYTGQLERGETISQLCYCMHEHMTQKDWTQGAKRVCEVRRDKVRCHLSGKPDPTYDPNAKVRPLEDLRILFENTPTTDPIGLECNAKCTETSGIIACSLTCPLVNEKRSNDQVCAEMDDYYYQNDWLKGATINCGVENNVLRTEFVGSAVAEN